MSPCTSLNAKSKSKKSQMRPNLGPSPPSWDIHSGDGWPAGTIRCASSGGKHVADELLFGPRPHDLVHALDAGESKLVLTHVDSSLFSDILLSPKS